MTQDELIALVREMREAQRDYFRHKTYDNLVRAKDLERRVDAGLASLQEPADPGLFD